MIAKSQREITIDVIDETDKQELELSFLEVIEVSEGGDEDRVYVDLTSLLEPEEGMIVGSSSKSTVLVHGETVESEFVPTRPFR